MMYWTCVCVCKKSHFSIVFPLFVFFFNLQCCMLSFFPLHSWGDRDQTESRWNQSFLSPAVVHCPPYNNSIHPVLFHSVWTEALDAAVVFSITVFPSVSLSLIDKSDAKDAAKRSEINFLNIYLCVEVFKRTGQNEFASVPNQKSCSVGVGVWSSPVRLPGSLVSVACPES